MFYIWNFCRSVCTVGRYKELSAGRSLPDLNDHLMRDIGIDEAPAPERYDLVYLPAKKGRRNRFRGV